jgi:outer membrane protein assembly factor BamB
MQPGSIWRQTGWRLPELFLLTCLLQVLTAGAENWPQWRGPLLNGSTPETNLPSTWSKTAGVAWSVPLPGKSGATPVVWNDRVFVPSPDEEKRLHLFCVDRRTGAVRWEHVVATGNREIGKNNMASCSAVVDGERVYALFGTSDFAAFDLDGKEIWHRQLKDEFGTFAVLFLYGASPLMHQGKLYVPLLQHNPPIYDHARDNQPNRKSVLICIDPATGKTLWARERPHQAPEEAMEAYTTPVPSTGPRGTEIILAGADCVTAHRPDDGEELWRFSGLNVRKNPGGRIVPSPVVAPGFVFACGPKREMLVALRTDTVSLPDAERVAWKSTQYVPDVCTPLFYQGKLFVLDGDRQMMTCYQPATGEKLWQGKLGVREIFYASPTGADGKIYCFSEEGTAVVLSAGDSFEVLGTIAMGEGPSNSSIVAANGALFIRTGKNLYCIERKP